MCWREDQAHVLFIFVFPVELITIIEPDANFIDKGESRMSHFTPKFPPSLWFTYHWLVLWRTLDLRVCVLEEENGENLALEAYELRHYKNVNRKEGRERSVSEASCLASSHRIT